MNPLFGQTRTRVGARHALFTPDGHVASLLPGVERARVIAHITPALGAAFSQFTIFLEADGTVQLPLTSHERFYFVREGECEITVEGKTHGLSSGAYAYVPHNAQAKIRAVGSIGTLVVFEKKFEALAAAEPPKFFIGHAGKIEGQPFLGNPRALLQVLLPDVPGFDLAVNIFTYEPGATLPFVETHVMEHGLLMLSGQGIYRLEDAWYPVGAGDVIWMAPFCPQWFVAMGDVPASYLYYKNVNRAFTS